MPGKVIAITGANGGLGRALAQRFAAEGEEVILLGRSLAKVQEVADAIGERAMAVACDVTSTASVRVAFAAIAERHPRLDVLINNAAIFKPFLIEEASDDQLLSGILTNLAGPIFCARSAIPMMERGGLIINVSSESVNMPFAHLLIYQSTKAGLERFSQGLSQELESSGIRVSVVRAGSMMEPGKVFDADPAALMRFHKAATEAGFNLRERPISQFTSATQVFRSLIDLPEDLQAVTVTLQARKA